MSTVFIDGCHLTVEQVWNVAHGQASVSITESAQQHIRESAALVERFVQDGQVIYGVNTGIGSLSNICLSTIEAQELQRRTVYSHAAGIGSPLPIHEVRSMMLTRANVIAGGYTGVRLATLQTLVEMLNRGVTPLVYSKGSVGASGDLAAQAQMAMVMMGEGRAFYKGELLNGEEALHCIGLQPVKLTYKEGLGLINGVQLCTGLGALNVYDAKQLAKVAQIISAMRIEALQGNMAAYDPRFHALSRHAGQHIVAQNIRRLVEGSDILPPANIQGAAERYTLRCVPQVLGGVIEGIQYITDRLHSEMNSPGDNPLFAPEESGFFIGGNFHGQSVAMALDYLGILMTVIAGFSERGLNSLLNPALSHLPDFLTPRKGLNSGLMVSQYTAASLVAESRILSHPASVNSIPVGSDQEDYVSMGLTAARKSHQVIENLAGVLAIEAIAAAQALEFHRPRRPGVGTTAAYTAIRQVVPPLEDDRPLYPDIEAVYQIVSQHELLKQVEAAIGELESL